MNTKAAERAAQSQQLIHAKALEKYRSELQFELEKWKAEFTIDSDDRRLRNEQFLALWRAILEYAQIAIKTIVLVNGAGATAVLAFLGSTLRERPDHFNAIAGKLGMAGGVFAIGVSCGVGATILAYLSQFKVMQAALRE